jgi:hypothetical protein
MRRLRRAGQAEGRVDLVPDLRALANLALALSTEEGGAAMMPAVLVTLSAAIDAFIGDLARRGRSQATRTSYRRLLNDFADRVRDKPPAELELADYERFLDRWTDSSPSTLASGVSLVRSFSRFLYERGWAAEDVAFPLQRPKRARYEDLDVVTVSPKKSCKCWTRPATGRSFSASRRPFTWGLVERRWPASVAVTST